MSHHALHNSSAAMHYVAPDAIADLLAERRDERARMVHRLWHEQIIKSNIICNAFLQTPREVFIHDDQQPLAYEDAALALPCNQTISQPRVIATMLESLRIAPTHTVLEVGSGTGYNAALLSRLCRRVFTIERIRRLAMIAEENLATLRINNVSVHFGDGYKGWISEQKFDRIIITAAAHEIPQSLIDQLKIGGYLVMPTQQPSSSPESHGKNEQKLIRVTKGGGGVFAEELSTVLFVPMLPGTSER